jgi:hypothetical protein
MSGRQIAGFLNYVVILGFVWVLVGQLIQSKLTIDDLSPVYGIVEKVDDASTLRLRSQRKDHELRIFLSGNPKYFRLMDIYHYERFASTIHIGDTVLIYIRPDWVVIFGLGRKQDIYQMSINGRVVFDLSETKTNERGIIMVFLIAIPLLLWLGKLGRRRSITK